MLANQHVKFYSRIAIVTLLVSTGALYYVANKRRTVLSSPSIFKSPHPTIRNLKEKSHGDFQINNNKTFVEKEKKLVYDGSVYK